MTKGVSTANAINYDAIASSYAVHRSTSPAIISHILAEMQANPPKNLLEIGCGTADHLFVLSKAWGIQGFGFDHSGQMLREGWVKNPGMEIIQANAERDFPYPSGVFTLAITVNVIHYIKDLAHFFSEVLRVLKPGGMVLTVTDSEDDIRNRGMCNYFPEIIPVELKRYHPISNIEQAMRLQGFASVRSTNTIRTFPMDNSDLEKYRNKAFSALRLISPGAFDAGIARLEADIHQGVAQGNERYTYVLGSKTIPTFPVQLRLADLTDIPALTHHRRLLFEEIGLSKDPPYSPSHLDRMETAYAASLASQLRNGSITAWIIETSGEIAASGALSLFDWPGHPANPTGRIAMLHSLYTFPRFRGAGLATQIIRAAAIYCKQIGCPHLTLHASKAGQALYSSLGFKSSNNEMFMTIR